MCEFVILLREGGGEAEGELGAAGGEILGCDGAAVGAGDFGDEAEAEAGAAEVVGFGAFAAVEGFEEMFEVGGGDAGAAVADVDEEVGAGRGGAGRGFLSHTTRGSLCGGERRAGARARVCVCVCVPHHPR